MLGETPRILALGNTASVLPSLAKEIESLYVACPTKVSLPVFQRNEKCFDSPALNNPLSVSCVKFVRRMGGKFDLFHAELEYTLACYWSRVPYGAHLHGTTDVQLLSPRTGLGRFLKTPYRHALENARYVLCHPAIIESVRRVNSNVLALELPVDFTIFNDRARPAKLGTKFSIFSPSRLDQWKGHETIWEALKRMKKRDEVEVFQSDWGWEPYYSALKRTAPRNVRFLPVVPREKIASYYRGADLVLGQMKIGHFGMSEVEAAACGVPVTVYVRDGTTPFLPKRPSAHELADLLDRLVEDPRFREDYTSSCTEFVLGRFGAKGVAEKFARAVQSVGGSPPQTSSVSVLPFMYFGTFLEVLGRVVGNRTFNRLKSALIRL